MADCLLGLLLIEGRPCAHRADSREDFGISCRTHRRVKVINGPVAALDDDQAVLVSTPCSRNTPRLGFAYGYSVRTRCLTLGRAFGASSTERRHLHDLSRPASRVVSTRASSSLPPARGAGPDPLGAHGASCAGAENNMTVAQPRRGSYFHSALARAQPASPATDRLHAEVDASPQGSGVACGGVHGGNVSASDG